MGKIKFLIRRNKSNNQINITPRRKQLSDKLNKKFDECRWLEVNEEDLFLE